MGPQTGEQRKSVHAALSAHWSSLTHSGTGGTDIKIRSQRTNGEPVYPAGQEQTAPCLTPVQIALRPQALMQGSAHFLFIHDRSPGQSSFTMHSGYEHKPSLQTPCGAHGLGSQGSWTETSEINKIFYKLLNVHWIAIDSVTKKSYKYTSLSAFNEWITSSSRWARTYWCVIENTAHGAVTAGTDARVYALVPYTGAVPLTFRAYDTFWPTARSSCITTCAGWARAHCFVAWFSAYCTRAARGWSAWRSCWKKYYVFIFN